MAKEIFEHDVVIQGKMMDFSAGARPYELDVNAGEILGLKLNQVVLWKDKNGSSQKQKSIFRGFADGSLWWLYEDKVGMHRYLDLDTFKLSVDWEITQDFALPNEISRERFSVANPPSSLTRTEQVFVIKWLQNSVNQFGRRVGDSFFVISLAWWNGFQSEIDKKLGQIDNSNLYSYPIHGNTELIQVKHSKLENYDFIFVHSLIWKFLFAWYGADIVLERKVIPSSLLAGEPYIELHLKYVTIIDNNSSKEVVGQFSKKDTLRTLKNYACNVFQLENTEKTILLDSFYHPAVQIDESRLDWTLEDHPMLDTQTVRIWGKKIVPTPIVEVQQKCVTGLAMLKSKFRELSFEAAPNAETCKFCQVFRKELEEKTLLYSSQIKELETQRQALVELFIETFEHVQQKEDQFKETVTKLETRISKHLNTLKEIATTTQD